MQGKSSKMLQKIKSGGFDIYTNEIIHPKVFNELYNRESILKQFETKITTNSHHPFATFLAKDRKNTEIKQGDFLILRAIKRNKKFEFITKIGKWGRFSVPKEVIKKLEMKNHENVMFEIIKEDEKTEEKEDFVDFADIKAKVFHRADNFVTIYKSYGTPITLPRFIKISPELIELCFLIHGDGSYKEKLYFVNKNPELHIFVMDKFYNIFKIPKETWRARLLFNNTSNSLVAKEKWKSSLDLRDEQFYPSISKCTLNTSEFGNLRIVIDKLIMAKIFQYVFERLKNLNERQSLFALNGLLFAEGGARIGKKGLHKITLSFSQQEKELFEGILKNSGISDLTKISQNSRFLIEGWENHCRFFKIFFDNQIVPFSEHSQRCEMALRGFLEHSFTQTMNKYLSILTRKSSFDVQEIIKETNNLPTSTLNTLRKSQYARFIEINGKGINRNPFKISITDEGRNFLKLIKSIREAYDEKCRLG